MTNKIIILVPIIDITNQKSIKLFIPLPRRLFQAIKRFLQQTSIIFLS